MHERAVQAPSAALSALSLRTTNGTTNGSSNEKQPYKEKSSSTDEYEAPEGPPPSATATSPPPYTQPPAVPTPAALTHAVALYAYTATDAGDLPLQANDRVAVTQYMNAEWWKGVSERTGEEGIFPRSYVRVEEKRDVAPPVPSSYGNMPVDVAMQPVGAGGMPSRQSKFSETGKKFGKKLGNAAIFGAGATIGSDLVNSIF